MALSSLAVLERFKLADGPVFSVDWLDEDGCVTRRDRAEMARLRRRCGTGTIGVIVAAADAAALAPDLISEPAGAGL